MAVIATCTDCRDEHPVGDRNGVPGTTECPRCDSTSYSSEANGAISKSENERIRDAIEDVRGVGEETLENILEVHSLYVELEAATVDDLVGIDNVGQATAERITEKVQ